jgi:N-acetylglucosamine malate deacetylase 1
MGESGRTNEEAGVICTAEAHKACQILSPEPVFVGQVNGRVEVTYERYKEYREILEAQRPDIVFTHWPIDSHEDHRANSFFVYDAWLKMHKRFALYGFEVMSRIHTSQFSPTYHVNITGAEARKRAACFAHASQQPAEFYSVHDRMNSFCGMEYGCKYAEAFVRHVQDEDVPLPLLAPG